MKLIPIPVLVSKTHKQKLDYLHTQGYSISGFIRALLDRELKKVPAK